MQIPSRIKRIKNVAHIAILIALPLLCPPAAAQSPGEPLLPAVLGDWQRAGAGAETAGEADARIMKEYGSLEFFAARYERDGRRWQVTVHRMRDSVGSYGAYTFFRAGKSPLDLGQGGAVTDGRLVFYQGNFLVLAGTEAGQATVNILARRLAGQPGGRMSRPALPEYMPRRGLINNSDRFLLGPEALNRLLPLASGDWAGFAYGAEAEYAEYRVDGLRAPLLLINYPTPQITLARLEEMAERFNLNGEGDPNRPLVHLLREGTLLFLLSREGISKEAAAALLEDHRYRRDLAWSEPQVIMTDEEWLRTIGGVFVAAGMMTLLVLVFSLAFGGLRYLATRLWPGRIFDRPEDTEILRLHLEEKPQARENP